MATTNFKSKYPASKIEQFLDESTEATKNAIKATEETTKTNEAIAREEAERVTVESVRVSNENDRKHNETARGEAENARAAAETKRQTDTATAISNANSAVETAVGSANTATTAANDAASNANAKAAAAQAAADAATQAKNEISDTLELKADKTALAQLEQEKAQLIVGKNKYNKNIAIIEIGKYIDWDRGGLANNDAYEADTRYVPILQNTDYYLSGINHYAIYDADKNYISGNMAGGGKKINSGLAYFIRISYLIGNANLVQIEESVIATKYESYEERLSEDNLPKDVIKQQDLSPIKESVNTLCKNIDNSFNAEYPNSLKEVDAVHKGYRRKDDVSFGWGSIISFEVDRVFSGVEIVPSIENAEGVHIGILEILVDIPDDAYGSITASDTFVIFDKEITNEYNSHFGNPLTVLLGNVTLVAGKKYAVYIRSASSYIGYSTSSVTFPYEGRCFYTRHSSETANISLAGSAIVNDFYFNLLSGALDPLYVPKKIDVDFGDVKNVNISPNICSFFTSYNLCKVEENEPEKYLSNVGGVATNESYFITGFIEVEPGKTYNATYLSAGGGSSNCLYDENKQFIGALSGINNTSITIPNTVGDSIPKFIRCSVNQISSIDNYVFTEFANEGYKPYSKSKIIPEAIGSHGNNEDEFLLWLPTEICIAEDRTIELYNNQVSWCGNINNYHFNWTGVGKNMKRKWSCKGLNSMVGQTKVLTCSVYDNNMNLVAQKTTTVKFVKKTIDAETKIVPLGDSLTNSKPWLSEVVSLSNNAIKFTGTRNPSGESAGLAHEGRSGGVARFFLAENEYTYESNGKDGLDGRDKKWNPMWNPNTASFDLNYYKSNYEITFDCIQIFFGTNGINIDPTAAVTEMVTLISKIREFEPTMKIFVVNTLFRGNQDGIGNGGATDGYVNNPAWKLLEDRKVFNLQVALTDACKSLENVFMIPVSVTHDSEYNFGSKETPVNPRALNTELLPTEATHPQLQGYQQFADIMFSTYCAYL